MVFNFSLRSRRAVVNELFYKLPMRIYGFIEICLRCVRYSNQQTRCANSRF